MAEVTLEEVLARSGALSAPLGCWLAIRVADAMSSARAPMPHEVILASDGSIRLAALNGPLHFGYMAPEIAEKAKAPTPRSAVFALAALLVESVTRKPPFARATDLATRLAAAEDEVAPLAGRVRDATPGLDAILSRALSKNPVMRFASPQELAGALDRHLTDELHEVGPASLARATAPAFVGVPETAPAPKRAPAPKPASKKAAARLEDPAAEEPARKSAPPRIEEVAPPEPAKPEPVKPAPTPSLEVPAERRSSAEAKRIEAAELDRSPQTRPARVEPDPPRAVRPRAPDPPRRPATGFVAGTPDIDERALRRTGPKTMVDDEAPAPSGPNWILRLVVALVLLLALAVVYQYFLRPYLG